MNSEICAKLSPIVAYKINQLVKSARADNSIDGLELEEYRYRSIL